MDPTISGFVDRATKRLRLGNSFVGIDIGASSTKVVQLAVKDHIVTVETYGEISNAPYADSEPGKAARASATSQADEVSDLLHEIDARSRRCGIAIPFNETLMNAVDLPKRDDRQMAKIVPAEAQQFIPVPLSEVMLDWYVIPEGEKDAFDTVKPGAETQAQFQKIMIIGVTKETTTRLGTVVRNAGLESDFYEIEIFSTLRASAHAKKATTLILDLGASSTKAYIVDEHWIMLSARMIPFGGSAITGEVMRACGLDFPAAERLKCEQGISPGSKALPAITSALTSLWSYTKQLLENHAKDHGKKVEQVLICGGGAYMPGILEAISKKLSLPVEPLRGFEKTTGPMILEDTFIEDGPRYAVAVGLALRGIGK